MNEYEKKVYSEIQKRMSDNCKPLQNLDDFKKHIGIRSSEEAIILLKLRDWLPRNNLLEDLYVEICKYAEQFLKDNPIMNEEKCNVKVENNEEKKDDKKEEKKEDKKEDKKDDKKEEKKDDKKEDKDDNERLELLQRIKELEENNKPVDTSKYVLKSELPKPKEQKCCPIKDYDNKYDNTLKSLNDTNETLKKQKLIVNNNNNYKSY